MELDGSRKLVLSGILLAVFTSVASCADSALSGRASSSQASASPMPIDIAQSSAWQNQGPRIMADLT